MLEDVYKRKFVYLRLSVTDKCNFRCTYCLPNGYQKPLFSEAELSVSEIRRLVYAFSKLGVHKVRLTGGEPTVRRDLLEIVRVVSSTPGIKKVVLSTNGSQLKKLAKPLLEAGVSSINISLDSLDPVQFKSVAGVDHFTSVLDGIEHALALGYESIKINTVLLKSTHHDELDRFMSWAKDKPVSVRFIELMKTGGNTQLFQNEHLSGGTIQFELLRSGWKPVARQVDSGPALIYEHPNYKGKIGIIAPYSEGFCSTCNRLRVTSQGALRLCLFAEGNIPLRSYLSSDSDTDALVHAIQEAVYRKPASHFLQEGKYGNAQHFAAIGG